MKALFNSPEFWTVAVVSFYNVLIPVAGALPNYHWLTGLVNVLGLLVASFQHSKTATMAGRGR